MEIKNNIITAIECKTRRDSLSKDITKYWNILKRENVVPKKYRRNYNLDEVLNQIIQMGEERVLMKLYLQCINMGLNKFVDLNAANNYITIFTLSEKQEQLFHLSKIPTLDTKTKRKKGKKNMEEHEHFTYQAIAKKRNELQLEINALLKKLEDFNNQATLDISAPAASLAA